MTYINQRSDVMQIIKRHSFLYKLIVFIVYEYESICIYDEIVELHGLAAYLIMQYLKGWKISKRTVFDRIGGLGLEWQYYIKQFPYSDRYTCQVFTKIIYEILG